MNKQIDKLLITTAMLALCISQSPVAENSVEHAAGLKWWREARFGMFIHCALTVSCWPFCTVRPVEPIHKHRFCAAGMEIPARQRGEES